jgi:hypothetical protein
MADEVAVMEGAISTWEIVIELIADGETLDGLRHIAQHNVVELRRNLAHFDA